MKKRIIIFDKQDITRLGTEALIRLALPDHSYEILFTETKKELVALLILHPESLVILDYTLSDLNSVDGLLTISARFQRTHWVLFSEELSIQFLKRVLTDNTAFNVVLKSSELPEIKRSITAGFHNEIFICPHLQKLLQTETDTDRGSDHLLTLTEKEILKEIAWGKTAKEIARTRNISVYTVITHRKNIYRKLEVNNSQEASRYALRAGIVDASDYYI